MKEKDTGEYMRRGLIEHVIRCSVLCAPLTLLTLMEGFSWLHSENEEESQRSKRELFRFSGLLKYCLADIVDGTMCLLGVYYEYPLPYLGLHRQI